MPVPASSALYYPYIDITNEQWLRSAVLFWDSIRTIVPFSNRDPYSSALARELNDEGVLEPVRVHSDMEEIEDLTDTVLDYLTDPAAASVMYGSDTHLTKRIHPQEMPHMIREWADLHPEKLPYMIRSCLDQEPSEGGWYRVAPGFANFYMTLLASRLSERLGLSLVTESTSADQLAVTVHRGKPLGSADAQFRPGHRGRHFEAFGPRKTLPTSVSPALLIDAVVQHIALPKHVPAKDLLRFKRDHKEELALFRREIARLATDIPKDASVEALRQAVADQYEAQVVPALSSLRQSLRAQKWDTGFNGFLKFSFFSTAPTSVAILAGLPQSVALVAGAGISITASAVLLANQRRKTRMESPYSYLLSLERQW